MAVTNQINADYLYDKEYYSEILNKNHFINEKLSYRIIDNCYVLPFSYGGIFDSEGKRIPNRSEFISGNIEFEREDLNLYSIAEKCNFKLLDTVHEKKTVVYIGVFTLTWGHFLTDTMRLMWFLRSHEYAEKFSKCQVAYSLLNNQEVTESYKRLLEIIGVDYSQLKPIKTLTRYDKLILPDSCFFRKKISSPVSFIEQQRFFTPEYVELIDAVRNYALEHSRPVNFSKVYFSYFKYKSEKTIGEDKLEKYFASKGYEIIYPEKLSLDEQLNILINCKSFASTIGSCSHNTLFLRDNTEIILIPRANYLTGYQVAINNVHKQNINYIDSSFSIFTSNNLYGGPFLYFISSNLRKFFHDENPESIVDEADFQKYLRTVLGYKFGRSFGIISENEYSTKTYQYYSVMAAEYFKCLKMSSRPVRFRKKLQNMFVLQIMCNMLRKIRRAVKNFLHKK